MGSCTKASPANTTSPILSLVKLSTKFSTISLLLANLDGTTSSASMEFDISKAMIVSMPLRFSLDIFDPICGRANMMMSKASAACNNQNLTDGRYFEVSAICNFKSSGSPNFFNFCLLRR